MQRSRRQNPYPFTFEIPLAAGAATLLLLVTGVHLGRGLANLLAGAGWAFPARADLFTSLPGILAGDPRAGLSGLDGAGAAPAVLWTCVTLTELLLLILTGLIVRLALDRWGPGRLKGMATRGEAERMLGLTRLRKVSAVVRPDLYSKQSRHR
jgi:hypothetical protein